MDNITAYEIRFFEFGVVLTMLLVLYIISRIFRAIRMVNARVTMLSALVKDMRRKGNFIEVSEAEKKLLKEIENDKKAKLNQAVHAPPPTKETKEMTETETPSENAIKENNNDTKSIDEKSDEQISSPVTEQEQEKEDKKVTETDKEQKIDDSKSFLDFGRRRRKKSDSHIKKQKESATYIEVKGGDEDEISISIDQFEALSSALEKELK